MTRALRRRGPRDPEPVSEPVPVTPDAEVIEVAPPDLEPRRDWRAQAFALAGIVLLATALVVFLRVRQVPEEPAVSGRAYLYLDSPEPVVLLTLRVEHGNKFEREPVSTYEVVFVQQPDAAVRWALVLSGDARVRRDDAATTSPGVDMLTTRAANPPFGGPDGSIEDVQIFRGEAIGRALNGTADRAFVSGRLLRPVASVVEARRSLALPQVGRAPSPPGFRFAQDKLPIGIPGAWFIPSQFEVLVDLGDRPLHHRVDLVAPDLEDQDRYRWRSGVSVRPHLRVTDLDQERTEEIVVFGVGVLSGVGAETVLIAVQLLTDRRHERRGRPRSRRFKGARASP